MFESFPKSIDNADKKVEGDSENIEFAETLQDAEVGEMELGFFVADLQADIEKQVDVISSPEEKETALKILSEFKESTFKSLREYALIAALALPGISNADINKEDLEFIDYGNPEHSQVIIGAIEDLKNRVQSDEFETAYKFFARKKGSIVKSKLEGESGGYSVGINKTQAEDFSNEMITVIRDKNRAPQVNEDFLSGVASKAPKPYEDEYILLTIHNHPNPVLNNILDDFAREKSSSELDSYRESLDNNPEIVFPPSSIDILSGFNQGQFSDVTAVSLIQDSGGLWKLNLDKSNKNVSSFNKNEKVHNFFYSFLNGSLSVEDLDFEETKNFFKDTIGESFAKDLDKIQSLQNEIVLKSVKSESVDHLISEYIKTASRMGYEVSYKKNSGEVIE